MSKLPVVSGLRVVKVLNKKGYILHHQKGSHMILKRNSTHLSVPNHKELRPGTLLSIIRQSGLTKEEFFSLL